MLAVKRLLLVLAMLAAPAWAAAPLASVDAVQMPAWLEHGGRKQPLAPGMTIAHGDVVRTGDGARAYLKFAEGSTVKLGENARLGVFSLSLKPQSVFHGALNVLGGAFRFTTAAARRVGGTREIMVRVGTATVGVRGTDLWGRSNAQEDLVCLIEGSIQISHAGLAAPAVMSEPMTFFVAPRGEAPKPVAAVDPAELRNWARQTEIEAGDGAVQKGGRWLLRLGRHTSEAEALAQYDAARQAGFAARIKPLAAEGGWHYDVVLAGFGSADDAGRAAARLKTATGIVAAIAGG